MFTVFDFLSEIKTAHLLVQYAHTCTLALGDIMIMYVVCFKTVFVVP